MANVNDREERGRCTVAGCDSFVCAKGMCNRHYLRNRKFGSPLLGGDQAERGLTPEERLVKTGWDEVEGRLETPCWEWRGSLDGSGYGQFHVMAPKESGKRRKRIAAHRLALELKLGRELAYVGKRKEYALHDCDNRKCVNPDHLRPGTQIDNTEDMMARGRQHRKFSPAVIDSIRRDWSEGMLQGEIADKYGASQPYVSEVVNGRKRRK